MSDVITPFWVHEEALDNLMEECFLKLYANDLTPTSNSTVASFSEVTGGGYSHATIATANWSTEYSNNPRDIILPEQEFTFTGVLSSSPATVNGWYLIDRALGYILAAKKLDSPYAPASGGGTLTFTPRIQAGNGTIS